MTPQEKKIFLSNLISRKQVTGISVFLFVFFCFSAWGQSVKTPALKPAMQISRSAGFMENKGQLVDQNQLPAPGVKYLFNSPGFNVQLRQTGFSYDTYTETADSIPAEKNNSPRKTDKNKMPVNYTRHSHRVDIEMLNCNPRAELLTSGESETYFNYFTTGTPREGITNVHSYREVTYKNIYPNIDLVFNASASTNISAEKTGDKQNKPTGAEYNFVVHPGGKLSDIQLSYQGANEVNLQNGNITVTVASGAFTENIPASYWSKQENKKEIRKPIKVNYLSLGKNLFGFSSSSLSESSINTTTSDLVIDPNPTLNWGSYFSGATQMGITTDKNDNTYFTGYAGTTISVTVGAYQTTFAGGNGDAFAAEVNSTGSALIWCTYYGGNQMDNAAGITLDAGNNVYITGTTTSTSGIATPGAYQTSAGGGTDFFGYPCTDVFVAKFNSTGTSLLWATYYGGTDGDRISQLAVDANDNVFITGFSQTYTNTPTTGMTTSGAYSTSFIGYSACSFIAELNSSGSALLWGTYYGADKSFGIAIGSNGNVYITGSAVSSNPIVTAGAYQTTYGGGYTDTFIAEFNPTFSGSSQLVWATYYGGSDQDYSTAIVLDTCGNIYINGTTLSTNGIATSGAYQTSFGGNEDIFLAKFNPGLSGPNQLLWGTYYGGSNIDQSGASPNGFTPKNLAIDAGSNLFLTGMTNSTNGIASAGAFQTVIGNSSWDGCMAKFSSKGALVWSTYLGVPNNGWANSIAVGSCQNIFIDGGGGANLLTAGSFDTNPADANSGFIASFIDTKIINVYGAKTICLHDSAVLSVDTCTRYTYAWTPATGLSATTGISVKASPPATQTYTVTGTSSSGCVASSTVVVTVNGPVINSAIPTNTSCGATDGSIVATASGGTGALTYSWSNLVTGVTDNNLGTGTYTLTVTDANSCSITNSVIVGSSNGPVVQTTTPVNELCNGNSTGSAALTISGGSSPYNYSWSNGVSSITNSLNNSITSLPANTYIVTITDKNGCTTTASFNITEPAAISTPVITPTNASCGASDGTAVASSSGGTGSLTYSWSGLAGGQTASGLSSATYTVSVTDANGCAVTNTVAIGNNGGPSVQNTTPVNELCHGSSTGSASVTVSGGSVPYTYSWSNAVSSVTTSLTNSIASLPSNTYIVTITDNNNCSTTTSIIITEPTAVSIPSTSATNSTCGNANGSANAISSGGTGILTYSWSSGATGQTATNLLVQTYTVSVKDANNCTVTKTVTIGNDNAPVAALSINTAILCNGGMGSITATATGGHPNYTYSWSSGTSSVTTGLQATLNNLTSTIYTVTITDVSGCSHTSSILLTEPSAVVINSVAPVNSNCGTATGSAVASASGGTGSLTYSWNNLASGQTNSSLAANTYTVTVTDANACSTSQTVTINNNGGPTINSIGTINELCHGASTGSASVNISGGASPYTYAWSPGATQITTNTQSAINNQQSGNYSVTIIDANGCQIVSTIAITEPVALTIASVSQINATCGQSNGSAKATVTGGTGLYTYSWSNGASSITSFTSTTINFVSSGSYTLLITDANGCTTSQSVPVSNNPAPTINGVTSSPVLCNGGNNGSAIVSATGTSALTYSWSSGSTTTTATGLSAAIYTVTVTDASGCQQLSVVTIAQPTAITVTNINTTSSSCNKNDGTAVATASGGAPVLTYTWSSGSTTATANNLTAGNYVLTVTDANGCVITNTVTINSTSGPTAVASVGTSIKCSGQTGSVTATASNGTLPYTYSWSAGVSGSGFQVSGFAGTYTVTIVDANGCSSISSITLTEPPAFVITTAKSDATCGNADGTIFVTASGGVLNYTYSWSNDSINPQITNLNSGTFSLTVTDANGCSQSTATMITNNNAPIAAAASAQTTITEGNSTLLIGSSTGTGVTYTWTPGASLNCSDCLTPTANPGTTTTYTLYVKDNMGCVDSSMITITVKKACTSDEDIYIANIFSPNNDGKNDVLNIEGNAITNIYWAIYDRWGNLLFETTDQAQGWDGTKNGNPMETGTYVYYLKAICIKTNAEIKLKGNVSIVK